MAANKLKVRFLGTNGWYDTKTGNTICILIETPKEYVVLDAGNGLYKLDQYIKNNKKPIYLFLSHFHLDHIIGLHILAKFNFKQGITLCIPKGSRKLLDFLVDQPFTAPFEKIKTKVKIVEVSKKTLPFGFLRMVLPLFHSAACMGFRFEFGSKTIAYVPDTGICANAFKLAGNADLLIAECAFKAGQVEEGWPHLTPVTAAEITKKSKAKKLALVHFDAAVYKTLQERKTAQKQAQRIFRSTIAAEDGMVLPIGGK